MSDTSHAVWKRNLAHIHSRFVLVTSVGFALTPVAGYSVAVLFGMSSPVDAGRIGWHIGAVSALTIALCGIAVTRWRHFLRPLFMALVRSHRSDDVPDNAVFAQRVRRYALEYWGLYVGYVLLSPLVFFGANLLSHSGMAMLRPALHFGLLQLVVAVLLGLPGFLSGINILGRLAGYFGLTGVQLGLRYQLLILVGFVPVLCIAILIEYYWWRTGFLSLETMLVWAALASVTVLMAVLAMRGLGQALRPVRQLLEGRFDQHISDRAVTILRPQSLDEIGYLTQMLGQLFRRIADQEAQTRAIIDTAAEGIIVVNERGRIEIFNNAAEQLFGYEAGSMIGQPLSWILPAMVTESGVPEVVSGEQETVGIDRQGREIPVSFRVSAMHRSGVEMYTCLVADITERRAAVKSIKHAEERYRHLVETAHDLVWSMDLQGRWTYLNKASKSIYGRSPEELLGKPIRQFVAPDCLEHDLSAFAEVLEGKELVHHETIHVDINNTPRHLSFNAKTQVNSDGIVIGISGTARDITEQKAFERRLAYQAQHDSLTGLANRRQFHQELERLLARLARSGGSCALLYIDLDQFKYINDTLGHAAGDRLLVEFSGQLRKHLREGDLFSRFGGDEFTVLLYNIQLEDVMRVAENLRTLVENYRFFADGNAYSISCSIGITVMDDTTRSVDECMAQADLACHLAKKQGRNRCYLYRAEDQDKEGMQADMGWAARVKETLENDRLQVVYQPIASVADNAVYDYEVLIRMLSDDGQVILPGGFLPAAERFGLIHSVDRWMVVRAIDRLADLHRRGENVRFSVNLSARAFEDDTLLPLIRERISHTGLNPRLLTFEITETATISNLSSAIDFIRALKEIGCQFALDDFGSGFSSFTYLKHLPVDKLKIDGSFVQNLLRSPVDQAMVRSMNQVAHALGKLTIAEYVENEATLNLLREYGVDYAQGNFIGKPQASITLNRSDPSATDPMPPAAMLQ